MFILYIMLFSPLIKIRDNNLKRFKLSIILNNKILLINIIK